MRIEIGQAADWLAQRDGFLILSHLRPDGDALGSAAGLCCLLRAKGKQAYVLDNPQTTARYRPYVAPWLAPEGYRPRHVVSVDLAGEGILQSNAGAWKGQIDLSIAHHTSNADYAPLTCVLPEKASCGEVILLLAKAMSSQVDRELATLLYIAVATDTGCFRYKNTTAETLRAAAELVEAGAPNGDLNKRLFMTQKRSRLQLESAIIEALEFYMDGELVIAPVTRALIARVGADEEDMEDIAVIAGQIEGVEMSITIRELADGEGCKVSVRTVKYANANEVCMQLGGGGHGMAAGCTLPLPMEQATQKMIEAARAVWKQDGR